ncbi:MAG: extracellular solute-binding protein [Clostridia bacterium]|nr:extracellular solute-binding protein [Clostridia bacterium]
MKLTRRFALVLAILLLLPLFGCEKLDLSGGKDSGTPDGAYTNPLDPNTLTVKTTVEGSEAFRPEGGADPKTDRILQQIAAVERETGYTVDVQIVSEESLSTVFLQACRSGKKYADVIQTDAAFLSRYYDEGYFLSLSQVGLSKSATGTLKKSDGTAYGIRADGWNNPLPTASYLLFYNERLLTERGCETPLQLQEERSWNWANFERLCKKVTDGEVFAIAYPKESETDLIWATLHAAGMTYFTDDGVCTMDSDEGINGFTTLRSLLNLGVTYSLSSYENSTADPTAKLAFTNRRTAFLVGNASLLFEAGEGSLFEELGEELRVIGFPAIKKGVTGATFSTNDVFCGITAAANTEMCKTVLPLLFATPEGTDPKEELIDTYFYHAEDGEVYFDLLASADTDTALTMNENRSIVEEYFLQIAKGNYSAKEYLSNLESVFNVKNS